ncbi:MAG TPA: hypothetical protein VK796_00455, partial [Cytophaga sp.]|nr:hypothetical protein [Cytophaga sp.]
DFVSYLRVPFLHKKEFHKNIIDKIRYNKTVVRFFPPVIDGGYKIVFQMLPPYEFNYFSSNKCLPIIIDVWKSDLNRLKEFCTYNKWVFIGSLEALQQLNEMGVKHLSYLPVSISKRYKLDAIPVKDIDLIVYGRNHLIMNSWIAKLKSETNFNIVECVSDHTGQLCAWSSQTGYLGAVTERKSLMQLIARSHYTAVSSPGNDELNEADKLRTGGFSPVTPRFLEAAVNYSIGIGIFPSNPDYTYCEISKAAFSVSSYEELYKQLQQKPDYKYWKQQIDDFLELHWTDKRIEKVIHKIQQLKSQDY